MAQAIRTEPAAADGDDGFASAAMVALVVLALRERAPQLLPSGLERIDGAREAHRPLALKRQLLRKARAELGPRFVFEIGRSFRALPFNPVVECFLRAGGGDRLLDQWLRFERYGHALHRTRVERLEPGHRVLHHYARSGPAPGPEHDLYVLGVIAVLLDAVGCRDLRITLLPGDRPVWQDGVSLLDDESVLRDGTDRWRLRWSPSEATVEPRSQQEPPANAALPMARRLHARLVADPARKWSLDGLARELGLSGRSLQRRLAAEDTSFRALVRSVRVGEACRLMEATDYTLTEIGFLCGFTDAAHFSRDFRSSVGTSPSEFRASVLQGVRA